MTSLLLESVPGFLGSWAFPGLKGGWFDDSCHVTVGVDEDQDWCRPLTEVEMVAPAFWLFLQKTFSTSEWVR